MIKNHSEYVDKEKVIKRIEDINKTLRKVEDIMTETNYSDTNKKDNKQESKLETKQDEDSISSKDDSEEEKNQ